MGAGRTGVVASIGLLLGLLSPAAHASTYTVSATADAYVTSSDPRTNYGTRSPIREQVSNATRRGYVRFTVPALDGPVTSAALRLYVGTSSASGFSARPVTSTSWS